MCINISWKYEISERFDGQLAYNFCLVEISSCSVPPIFEMLGDLFYLLFWIFYCKPVVLNAYHYYYYAPIGDFDFKVVGYTQNAI